MPNERPPELTEKERCTVALCKMVVNGIRGIEDFADPKYRDRLVTARLFIGGIISEINHQHDPRLKP